MEAKLERSVSWSYTHTYTSTSSISILGYEFKIKAMRISFLEIFVFLTDLKYLYFIYIHIHFLFLMLDASFPKVTLQRWNIFSCVSDRVLRMSLLNLNPLMHKTGVLHHCAIHSSCSVHLQYPRDFDPAAALLLSLSKKTIPSYFREHFILNGLEGEFWSFQVLIS